jgi:hypothetical protein
LSRALPGNIAGVPEDVTVAMISKASVGNKRKAASGRFDLLIDEVCFVVNKVEGVRNLLNSWVIKEEREADLTMLRW